MEGTVRLWRACSESRLVRFEKEVMVEEYVRWDGGW